MSTLATTNLKHASSGSNNIVLDSSGGAAFSQIKGGAITSGTAVASTSGTSIDFTSIPSWVKRITVMFAGVSTTGGSSMLIQLGDSGGIESSGYASINGYTGTGTGVSSSTAGFLWMVNNLDTMSSGQAVISKITGNSWVFSSIVARTNDSYVMLGGASKTLSDTLDRVRVTTSGGTDTFDAGTINILYEG